MTFKKPKEKIYTWMPDRGDRETCNKEKRELYEPVKILKKQLEEQQNKIYAIVAEAFVNSYKYF